MRGADFGRGASSRRDARSYDPVAGSFDRWSRRVAAPVARRMVALARVGPGARILDVGTGTGVVAFEAKARGGTGSRVTGLDHSEGMLRTAAGRAGASAPDGHASFVRGDAETLPFPDASFDAVLSLYALLHFSRPEAALAEMHRVLRPDGRIAVGIGVRPPLLTVSGLAYALRRLPLAAARASGRRLAAPDAMIGSIEGLGAGLSDRGDPEAGHPRSMDPGALVRLLRAAGFVDVRRASCAGVVPIRTPDEFWDLQATLASRARLWLAQASAEDVDRVRQDFDARCRRVLSRGGRLVYPYAATLALARRPDR